MTHADAAGGSAFSNPDGSLDLSNSALQDPKSAIVARGRPARFFGALAFLLLVCASPGADTFPPGWSPEVGEAFGLYYAGRYGEAGSACRAIAGSARSDQVRRDAEALAAMALMRQEARNDRIEGRTRLGQAARGDLSLMDRPDCRFALGAARSALNETSTALGELLAALDGFEREKRTERTLEACVVIADTWARFGEWNMPIPGLPLAAPDSPEAADRERARRVAEMRTKAAGLPGSDDALRQIDLISARRKLARPDSRAAGLEMLRALASVGRLDDIAADAALRLAEELMADNRGAEAVEVYGRVAAARLGERSQRAESLAAEASRPRVELSVARTPRPGRPLRIDVTANHVRSIELELRRVDLAKFLSDRQGVLLEQALPDDGAVIGSQSLAPAGQSAGRWTAVAEFVAPAGALVAIASAIDASGAPLRIKQVIVVSDLDAVVIAGSRQALVVAAPGASGAKARFWMQGSFVPVEIDLAAGCAAFALPPEARLLRDRRWVCLLQSEAGVALCRGSLAENPESSAAGRSVVCIAPEHPRAGEEVIVAGILAGDGGRDGAEAVRGGVEIELCDTLDEVRARVNAAVDPCGVFSARIRISPELAGAILHPVVRTQGRVLSPLYRPVTARVATGEPRHADVDLNIATAGSANEGLLRGALRGLSAWGRPLAGERANYKLLAVRLPGSDDDSPRAASPAFFSKARLDNAGRTSLSHPMAVFNLPAGAIAMNAEATVNTSDGRAVTAQREVLAGAGPAHVWIELDARHARDGEESRGVRVGDVVSLAVGWFDPQSLASGGAPSLAIRAPGSGFVEYSLRPDRGGLLSADWSPWCAGTHELRATLPLGEGGSATALRQIDVSAPGAGRSAGVGAFDARVRDNGRDAIDVSLVAADERPRLVVIVAQDPLGAAWLPARTGEQRVTIPIGRLPAAGATAALFELRDGVLLALGSRPVAAPIPELRVKSPSASYAPGSQGALTIELADGGSLAGATLIARLTTAHETGAVDWMQRAAALSGSTPTAALPTGGSGMGVSPAVPAVAGFPSAAGLSLLRGSGLWSGVSRAQAEVTRIRVPLPATSGEVRLRGIAIWPDRRVAVLNQPLTIGGPVELLADVPEVISLGDRSIAVVRLCSASGRPVSGVLRAKEGRGLTLGAWSVGSGRAEVTPTPGEPAASVVLPASGAAYLRLPIEAAATGRGSLRFEFVGDDSSIGAEAFYRVLDGPARAETQPADASAKAPFRIQRKLYVVAPLDARAQAAIENATDPRLVQTPALANQPRFEIRDERALPIGTMVLVEESIESDRLLRDVSWVQHVPANCVTRPDSPREWRALSAAADVRYSQYSCRLEQLAAGTTTHQYAFMVNRPGSCGLPLPVARSESNTLRTELVSPPLRIVTKE